MIRCPRATPYGAITITRIRSPELLARCKLRMAANFSRMHGRGSHAVTKSKNVTSEIYRMSDAPSRTSPLAQQVMRHQMAHTPP